MPDLFYSATVTMNNPAIIDMFEESYCTGLWRMWDNIKVVCCSAVDKQAPTAAAGWQGQTKPMLSGVGASMYRE